jgi:methylated-DNA-protein-cysteine methyltransferase-like protein
MASSPGGSGRLYGRIYDVARRIPKGRVATYGQLAAIVGRCTPRQVGYAMAAVPYGSDVPWHRVINGRGMVSERGGGDGASVQRQMLEAEGVRFDEWGRVDLSVVGWKGPESGG